MSKFKRKTEVIWGNQDAINYRLDSLGDTRELTEWYAHWQNGA